jgi:hypothetical protein
MPAAGRHCLLNEECIIYETQYVLLLRSEQQHRMYVDLDWYTY